MPIATFDEDERASGRQKMGWHYSPMRHPGAEMAEKETQQIFDEGTTNPGRRVGGQCCVVKLRPVIPELELIHRRRLDFTDLLGHRGQSRRREGPERCED